MKKNFYETNSYYEGLVQNQFAGSDGCFCAFMTFFYQYNQSIVFMPELSETFSKLYQFEIKNCEILSQMLIKLNGDNKFYSSAKRFLSGHSVNYTKNFKQAFLNDIEMLEVGLIEIKNMILKIENPYAKSNLREILENKREELKILRENYLKNNLI